MTTNLGPVIEWGYRLKNPDGSWVKFWEPNWFGRVFKIKCWPFGRWTTTKVMWRKDGRGSN